MERNTAWTEVEKGDKETRRENTAGDKPALGTGKRVLIWCVGAPIVFFGGLFLVLSLAEGADFPEWAGRLLVATVIGGGFGLLKGLTSRDAPRRTPMPAHPAVPGT